MSDLEKHTINESASINEAFIKLNEVPVTLTLFVTNNNGIMTGTLTDGDIRRGFLRGLTLTDKVSKFMSARFHFLLDGVSSPDRIKQIRERGIRLIPSLDKDGRITGIIDLIKVRTILPVDAVLMAGGRGERLRPLTDKVPKPMLLAGNKPILEHNIDHLRSYGITDYYITLRYLPKMIEDHFGDGSSRDIKINYLHEKDPLGTIGSVGRIETFRNDNILVMNGDLFTNIDIEDFYNEYISANADMAIAAVPYTVDIPYAVLNLENNKIVNFQEKPTYTYHSNAGIYLIKKELLKVIPSGQRFDATDFIQTLLMKKMNVLMFPIIGYWIDIGKPDDYKKVQEIAKHIN